MPGRYRKRDDGQTYLQTNTADGSQHAAKESLWRPSSCALRLPTRRRGLTGDAARWLAVYTALSSGQHGKIKCGFAPVRSASTVIRDVRSRAQLAAAVRDRLGLPRGKRVVLYAPTWRDNQFYAAGTFGSCSVPADLQVDGRRPAVGSRRA